jgi:hypothetical protein
VLCALDKQIDRVWRADVADADNDVDPSVNANYYQLVCGVYKGMIVFVVSEMSRTLPS